MLRVVSGDLLKAEADAVVNTVNTVGVMGKGLALQFKRAFPENFSAYEAACRADEVRLGSMFVTFTGLPQPRVIVNFPTKGHFRDNSELRDIESGLVDLVRVVKEHAITSIAVPPLGCGLGRLCWEDVRPLIDKAFGQLPDVDVLLYAPV